MGLPRCPATRAPQASRYLGPRADADDCLRRGPVTDQAELARLGHVTRARLRQIMNLLNLAPGIQDEILFLLRTEQGRDPISQRNLRAIAAVAHWRKRRRMWRSKGH